MISFGNKNFPTKYIESSNFGNVIISVQSLNELLMDKSGDYVSCEARFIDEEIFYFIEDNLIDLSSKQLDDLLNSEIR